MNTTTLTPFTNSTHPESTHPTSPLRRFFGVVAQPQSYRNIGYLLVGLPLGTAWFALLVSGLSVGASMLVVALLGIPILLGMWYVVRGFANVERGVANVLLGQHLAPPPMASGARGNLWVRLRSMSGDRLRWREFGYLMLRFPAGIATFTAAVAALAIPLMVAFAPFTARYGGEHPFGHWAYSSTLEDVASASPWSWLLVPLGLVMMIGSVHLLNAMARACGRWVSTWLGVDRTK